MNEGEVREALWEEEGQRGLKNAPRSHRALACKPTATPLGPGMAAG